MDVVTAKRSIRSFTAAERAEIVERYQSGETCHALGDEFGAWPMTIWNLLRKAGVETRRRGGRVRT